VALGRMCCNRIGAGDNGTNYRKSEIKGNLVNVNSTHKLQ